MRHLRNGNRDGLHRIGLGDDKHKKKLVPRSDKGKNGHHRQTGSGERQRNLHQRLPTVASVDPGGIHQFIGQIPEKIIKHPYGKRQGAGHHTHYQGCEGVQKVQSRHHQIQRNKQRDGRHHSQRYDKRQQESASRKPVFAQTVAASAATTETTSVVVAAMMRLLEK